VTSLQKSTIVRKNNAPLAIKAAFSVGSWIAPQKTIARAVELFCKPSGEARRRAAKADDAGAGSFVLKSGPHELHVYQWGDPSTEPFGENPVCGLCRLKTRRAAA